MLCRQTAPIVINCRLPVPKQKSFFHLRGLLFGIDSNGDPIWMVPFKDGPKGLYLRSFSGHRGDFVEDADVSDGFLWTRYMVSVADGADARRGSSESWTVQRRDATMDAVLWGLRRVDAGLLGARGPRAWLPEVLTFEEPIVLTIGTPASSNRVA